MIPPLALPFVLALSTALPACQRAEQDFAATWYDGRAELCGYAWSGSRYGELRDGEAVAIFVTEPFSTERHVKVDDPQRAPRETVTALKLNLVRDFQTGIYDYNTMASLFVRADDFGLMKLSFSSAEWCGHVYEELDRWDDRVELATRSYFEGESEARTLPARRDGLVEDQLFVWLRGLRGAPLEPGASRELPFLAGPFERRLRHRPAEWGTATIRRAEAPRTVEVPAGSFEAIVYEVAASDGRVGRFEVEAAAPHRLLSWRWSRGEETLDAGRLTGSQRLPYWELQRPADAERRAALGLAPR